MSTPDMKKTPSGEREAGLLPGPSASSSTQSPAIEMSPIPLFNSLNSAEIPHFNSAVSFEKLGRRHSFDISTLKPPTTKTGLKEGGNIALETTVEQKQEGNNDLSSDETYSQTDNTRAHEMLGKGESVEAENTKDVEDGKDGEGLLQHHKQTVPAIEKGKDKKVIVNAGLQEGSDKMIVQKGGEMDENGNVTVSRSSSHLEAVKRYREVGYAWLGFVDFIGVILLHALMLSEVGMLLYNLHNQTPELGVYNIYHRAMLAFCFCSGGVEGIKTHSVNPYMIFCAFCAAVLLYNS